MSVAGGNLDSFKTAAFLDTRGGRVRYFSLPALEKAGVGAVSRLPYCLRILLENLLRNEDGVRVTKADAEALAGWRPGAGPGREIPFFPARVLLQDFTGVPVIVDLASMRDAAAGLGRDPAAINPAIPVDLVIDHSVQVDCAGAPDALERNVRAEYERNRERYSFIRWGQTAFRNLRVVPPSTGIVHQINLEHLATVVERQTRRGELTAFPDTVLGTDSHTTMVNALGVAGWGVGGIEAEAAMLGEAVTMEIPDVVGVRLTGRIPDGATIHDAVLLLTSVLRQKGVVGKFVEFTGDGAPALSIPDRATLANMAPEYGATMGFFPVDARTLEYLELTGRTADRVTLVEAWCRAQGLFREPGAPEPEYSETVVLDLGKTVPAVAGPRRPQDLVPLAHLKDSFTSSLTSPLADGGFGLIPDETGKKVAVSVGYRSAPLSHGSVVIAAITSCTSTSNPAALLTAGLLARNAAMRGLTVPPTVKTSFSPGSRVAADWLKAAELTPWMEKLGFHVTGFGCMTCIGNSGPIPDYIAQAIRDEGLVTAAVLSGNRNFEGRIHPLARTTWLASPPLVVAFAIAGRVNIDFATEPLGKSLDGTPVFLANIWPGEGEINATMEKAIQPVMFMRRYAEAFGGDSHWQALTVPVGARYAWEHSSTYIRRAPFFDGASRASKLPSDISGARALMVLGDSVTTDHISPAGSIPPAGAAGEYLRRHGVAPGDFNSFGSRRGNHEVMARGAFEHMRLRNNLVSGAENGLTAHLPDGHRLSPFDAAEAYRREGVPLIILAGRDYGMGSSRDWAAKGPALLGVRAVIATSFERIHRSNLVEMGVLPLEFAPGQDWKSLKLTGREIFGITGIAAGVTPRKKLRVSAKGEDGKTAFFEVTARIDTAADAAYFRHGGILPYVLKKTCGIPVV